MQPGPCLFTAFHHLQMPCIRCLGLSPVDFIDTPVKAGSQRPDIPRKYDEMVTFRFEVQGALDRVAIKGYPAVFLVVVSA